MDIQIIEHAGHDNGYHYASHYLDTLMGQDTREFRIDTTANADLHAVALKIVMELETKRQAELFEGFDCTVDEIWEDSGRLHTTLDDGTVLLVTTTSASVYLPVHDGFEDKETHWVAAVPVIRKLLLH